MMKRITSPHAVALFRQLGQSSSGLALTEFAFALPILLVLLFGGLETANLALTHLRVNQIAMTVADNAGRVRTGIDESQIYEVFAGADLAGQSINFSDNGRIVLSSLQPNGRTGGSAGQMINWQRCHGELDVDPAYGVEGLGRTNNAMDAGMGPTGNKITSDEGTAVMFVEVTYQYTPAFSAGVLTPRQIRYESAFNVRERTNQNITNTQGLVRNWC
ncbi:MAG TPA: TadE/TadG family type IV pilus assembly protein [Devosia sp.]|nr:TadE/TadG family type IV pilus assembly protein [Devosia sp.]